MSFEPFDNPALCAYDLIADRVHEFRMRTSTRETIAAYRQLCEYHLPNFWQNSVHFDGILRIIQVYESAEAPSFAYIYQEGRKTFTKYQDAPKKRIAYVIPPIPNFIKGIQTYAELTGQINDVTRRFFYMDEYDEALKWVMKNV